MRVRRQLPIGREGLLELMIAMDSFTIELPEEQANQLRKLAREAGVTPEQLLRAGVDGWLTRPSRDFAAAAEYVLRKNFELYRRLA